MRVESRARARALQALYAWDMRLDENLMRLSERLWDDLRVPPTERSIATALVAAVSNSAGEIDALLRDVTSNWRLERLGAIERSVLRLGAAELGMDITPPKVVIQESVRLAERYGTRTSAAFVNGVLDALARKTARL